MITARAMLCVRHGLQEHRRAAVIVGAPLGGDAAFVHEHAVGDGHAEALVAFWENEIERVAPRAETLGIQPHGEQIEDVALVGVAATRSRALRAALADDDVPLLQFTAQPDEIHVAPDALSA